MAAPTSTRRGSATGRFARASGANRSQGLRRRRPPEPTGFKKVLGAVLPAAAAKQAAPSSKKGKAGGLALAAAAAGVVFKNRDKLNQMRRGGATHASTPPSTPTV
jgi:hypothetical protein